MDFLVLRARLQLAFFGEDDRMVRDGRGSDSEEELEEPNDTIFPMDGRKEAIEDVLRASGRELVIGKSTPGVTRGDGATVNTSSIEYGSEEITCTEDEFDSEEVTCIEDEFGSEEIEFGTCTEDEFGSSEDLEYGASGVPTKEEVAELKLIAEVSDEGTKVCTSLPILKWPSLSNCKPYFLVGNGCNEMGGAVGKGFSVAFKAVVLHHWEVKSSGSSTIIVSTTVRVTTVWPYLSPRAPSANTIHTLNFIFVVV
ncbi:hypothetical protein QCA50_019920 [Cerrena zonata]|uniref:Uncharacterized protein n=1 Tax=Cerrena zonata TaxID=2478898 RepID=A0AAW0FAC2_9APHY